MVQSTKSGVVVGIDSSTYSEHALDWAATEAALRGVALRIAHSWDLGPYRMPDQDRGDIARSAGDAAAELLRSAQEQTRKHHPDLQVDTTLLAEDAVPGLIRLAGQAELVVVGARGLSRFASVLIGSVSQRLVAHAPCPVVVLRDAADTAGTAEPATAAVPAPVLLAAGPGEAPEPIRFAFAEAARRNVPVLVVRAWQYPPNLGGYIPLPLDDLDQRDATEREELAQTIADARETFPQVPTVLEAGMHEPAGALVDASSRACLLVVGAQRPRHRFAMPVGRVAQQVLHYAHCPVAVVPHP